VPYRPLPTSESENKVALSNGLMGYAVLIQELQKVPFPVTAFYKGESQGEKLPGDWKEQRFLPGSPAHVMLGGSWGFLFSQSHVVAVTTSSVSDATSRTVAKIANHSSI